MRAVTFDDGERLAATVLAAFAAAAAAVRWWYATRKLDRVDRDGSEMSRSLRWMMSELRAEVARVKEENAALRQIIAAQADRITHLEALEQQCETRLDAGETRLDDGETRLGRGERGEW